MADMWLKRTVSSDTLVMADARGEMLAAVTQNGFALQWASAERKADREVVLAAVAQDGLARSPGAARFASIGWAAGGLGGCVGGGAPEPLRPGTRVGGAEGGSRVHPGRIAKPCSMHRLSFGRTGSLSWRRWRRMAAPCVTRWRS